MIYLQVKKGTSLIQKTYKKSVSQWWLRGTTIISNAGQGEVLMTPIQLANMMATVANEGYYYTSYYQKNRRSKIDEIHN
jgi:penicillin-binding protein 2